MGEAWKEIDLQGGGLQSANLRLAALLRTRRRAAVLLLLFPLGLHRDYLHDRRGAWVYRAATLAALAAVGLGHALPAALVFAAEAAGAVRDLLQLDDTVARVNKALRMRVYLGQGAGAPAQFEGRYTDDPQASAPDAPAPRVRSFAEQERRLRELAAARRKNPT